VTYVVEGEQYHRDSRGHAGTIAMRIRGGPMHARTALPGVRRVAVPRADLAFALAPGATTLVLAMRGSALLSGQPIVENQLATTRGVRSHVSIGAGSSGFEGLVLSAVPVGASTLTHRHEASRQ
jgi:redox-sensitive bicupin YhaK (pirin superfamily)